MRMNYRLEELLPVVQKLTERYTSKASSSITYERAQQLMGAVLYCLNEAWEENGQEAARGSEFERGELREKNPFSSAEKVYEIGYYKLIQKVEGAKRLYNEKIGLFQSYGNRAYYDTVVKGMPEFFLRYDPRFCPQDSILTLDYPVLERLEHLRGADRICRYLECIWLEQEFLNCFSEETVRRILVTNNMEYKELFVNICAELLKKVLCSFMLEVRPKAEPFERAEYLRLEEMIQQTDQSSLEGLFITKLRLITAATHFECTEIEKMERYLEQAIPNIAAELINGAAHNCLQNMV
ncbi:hypothetical protein DXA13_05280 [Clostridium sp. AM58-1XD]|nr:hypothetical protein DXA13_05280 [Clostridium sp. AM58-1XD]